MPERGRRLIPARRRLKKLFGDAYVEARLSKDTGNVVAWHR
jgi:hypothetical protein